MPRPGRAMIKALGGTVRPFERCGFAKELLPGEEIELKNHRIDYTDDGFGKIKHRVKHALDEIRADPAILLGKGSSGEMERRYLWLLTNTHLWILLENTPVRSSRGCACHTNILGPQRAVRGGEIWFLESGEIVFNSKSGRYSNVDKQRDKLIAAYLEKVCGAPVFFLDCTCRPHVIVEARML